MYVVQLGGKIFRDATYQGWLISKPIEEPPSINKRKYTGMDTHFPSSAGLHARFAIYFAGAFHS